MKGDSHLTRKREFLFWTLVLVIVLTSVSFLGCGKSEAEVTNETETTTETDISSESDTTNTPFDPSQRRRGGGLMFETTGILGMLAAIEDEVIETSLQEALDAGRITSKQAGDISIW